MPSTELIKMAATSLFPRTILDPAAIHNTYESAPATTPNKSLPQMSRRANTRRSFTSIVNVYIFQFDNAVTDGRDGCQAVVGRIEGRTLRRGSLLQRVLRTINVQRKPIVGYSGLQAERKINKLRVISVVISVME